MTTAPDAVPVRDAATVVLLRDGAAGLEAWLLTRRAELLFAAGMSVFPGGRVDAGDAQLPIAGDLSGLAERLGCDLATAAALVGAAVRETFEETGVLLTVPPAAPPGLAAARADVEAGRLAFGRLLAEHALQVDAEALRPWARWVTPSGEVRRYDTRFFVGALPAGASPANVTTESSTAGWVALATALQEGRRGVRGLLPPTAATLASLAPFASVQEALAAAEHRSLEPVRPRFVQTGDGNAAVQLPDGSVVPVARAVPR
jgi:8-oxo-dGTP pyrophosphatase MutT (NUDIX family)